ncbi:hypothetical protein [Micromonospora sp. NPDC048063]|uniref:hypothetical protein n=1 Tax=Micromonospora sp. NPDC048063 TaxID=3364256 RepID=UPI0037125809
MPIDEVFNSPWTRKHDDPRFNLIPQASRIVYPTSLPELIELCRDREPDERFKAAGSHWALSRAAISDHTFIETHDPRNVHQAMGRTLISVIPGCLNRDYVERMVQLGQDIPSYLVHVEAGKRIYQLYAELDQVIDVGDPSTLAGYINRHFGDPRYGGPWAFATLGGAGGQTVVGAFNTGTHGGDFDRPPLADSVLAIHLVADGGKHYWIEAVDGNEPHLTDDFLMSLEFRTEELGGAANFELIRDNNVFDAVLVSAGRFGVIYSVVLKAVPQYALYERRRLHLWQDIRHQIKDVRSPLYTDVAVPAGATFVPSTPVFGDQRFLQIAVCLTTHANFQRNLVGITKRWTLRPPVNTAGRDERVGRIVDPFDQRLQAPRFERAGANHAFSPDPDDPHKGADPGMLERACADSSFLKGIIGATIEEIERFVNSKGAVVGTTIAAVAVPGGVGLLALIPALLLTLVILKEILDAFDDDSRFGEQMEHIKNELLDPDEPNPAKRAAGLLTWQLIYYAAFQSQQGDRDYEAISYAVMDQRDYLNVSCEVNVDSVEVFFDAVDDRLIAFVDSLIAFEMKQEFEGKAFVGYASLRFTKRTRALIGMQKFDTTCSVEVACLRDVSGSQELVDYAVKLARNPNIRGLLHWGQRNDNTRDEVEGIYGDSPLNPGGNLGFWRQALRHITEDGGRNGFSSEFTRQRGLEEA